MKPESVSPARPPEHAQSQRGQTASSGDAPTDLFATLLFAADQGLGEAQPPLSDAESDPRHALDTVAWLAADALPTGAPSDTDPALKELLGLTVGAQPPSDETAFTTADNRHPSAALEQDTQAVGQWVSTVAKARSKTPPPQLLTQLAQASLDAAGQAQQTERSAWHANAAGQAGGLLTDTLGSPEELDLGALGSSSTERSGEQREQGQGQRGEPGRVILEAAGGPRQAQDAPAGRPFAAVLGQTLGGAMDDAFEHLGTQVSLWAAGNAKKANLRLEAGLRQALDVEVSLQGDKAHLAFRTDDAQVREALRAQAQDVLAHMLARAGIALEGLSVGSQDRDHSREPGADDRGHRTPNAEPESSTSPPTVQLGRIAGAGLSVYA